MPYNIAVIGLGYVGCVSAACLARLGHTVIGVDVNRDKVAALNGGRPTVLEDGLSELVSAMVAAHRLSATDDLVHAIAHSDIALICVGTPSQRNGSIDISHVTRVSADIGTVLRDTAKPYTVVIRSTVLPGSVDAQIIPLLERQSGRANGDTLHVAFNPEFLREGSSLRDFDNPPFTVIGTSDPTSASRVADLYAGLDAALHVVPIRVAEMLKYACNCYHALKVAFANEIGAACKAFDIDSHAVMKIFAEDRRLNISSAYLTPGFAFGGSCLPKDLRAMLYAAQQADLELPVLRSTLLSNQHVIARAADVLLTRDVRRVALLGLSFKTGTDDLRESPLVTLAEQLLGKGIALSIYDPYVSTAYVTGANRAFIEAHIPHIWALFAPELEAAIAGADAVVVGNPHPDFRRVKELMAPHQLLLDLVRISPTVTSDGQTYEGIAW